MSIRRPTSTLKLAWWFWPYIYCLAAFCAVTGIELDEKKMSRVIDRAIRGSW